MRVTTQMAVDTLVSNLDRSFERITRYQNNLSSGTRLNNLSDDPAAAQRSLALRTELRNFEQFRKNIDDGAGWLQLSEATLNEMESLFVEAGGLAVQGASDTYNTQQRQAIADQIDQFLEHTLNLSEARYRGRYIFGGTQTADPPYEAVRDESGTITELRTRADTSGSIEREVSDGIVLQINIPGKELFEGEDSAFRVLIELREALRADDTRQVQSSLGALSRVREQISASRGLVGARVNRMEITRNLIDRVSAEMTAVLSADEDTDLADTILNLRQEQDVFQAALSSGGSVVPQSLMDFIG
ncbi:MAG: flagellar hook-associated protein FlgL [Candidatus Handelsmanbacteria bacterium]|nr:flagellar hook-associated protein FlgL [Candidatus Handelsmanbacteria bacterium]